MRGSALISAPLSLATVNAKQEETHSNRYALRPDGGSELHLL
jgi:hypothetical protein